MPTTTVARPDVQRDGDTWLLTWLDQGFGIGFDHLETTRSDGLKAEVTVESNIEGRLAGPATLNLLSVRSQSEVAGICADRNGHSRDEWKAVFIQACAIVAQEYRAPSPTIRMRDFKQSGPIKYIADKLIPKGESTLLYADGESGKSLLAQRIALSYAGGLDLPWGEPIREQGNVLYLDTETNSDAVGTRLRRLAIGMGLGGLDELDHEIFYRGTDNVSHSYLGLLDHEIADIRAQISRDRIGLVIVDSISYAIDGSLVEDGPARLATRLLRQMAPATRLVTGHVNADTAKQTHGKGRPFGSVYFWNGMRSCIEVRSSEERNEALQFGLYHQKFNEGAHHRDLAVRASFAEECDGIAFRRADLEDIPDLVSHTSLSGRLRAALRAGSQTSDELGPQVGADPATCDRTLRRMPGIVNLNPGRGRGHLALWGLSG